MGKRVSIEAVFCRRGNPPALGSYFIVRDGETTEVAIERRLKRCGLGAWVRSDSWSHHEGRIYRQQYSVTAGKASGTMILNEMEFVILTDEEKEF